jgi:hypothetical protein
VRLLRGLGSQLLECGCLTGVYETYDGTVVVLIDARGRNCPFSEHQRHAAADVNGSGAPAGGPSRPVSGNAGPFGT